MNWKNVDFFIIFCLGIHMLSPYVGTLPLYITAHSRTTLNRTTLSITTQHYDIDQNDFKRNDTQHNSKSALLIKLDGFQKSHSTYILH
jgi:hypothetical protein